MYSGEYNIEVINETVEGDKVSKKGILIFSGPWREPAKAADK